MEEFSVKKKFVSGIAWSVIQNILVKGITFVIGIVLARILSPDDFGLIGMIIVFTNISEVFVTSGFGEALIQKEDSDDNDYSTAFCFNLLIAVFIYIILYVSAPFIADFYHEPILCPLARVLCVNFVIGSFNIAQHSKLTKALDFRSLALITLGGVIVGGSVGMIMAYNGYGVWSLVAQTICTSSTYLFAYPFFTKWYPKFSYRRESFIKLWNYGSKMLITGIFSAIQTNLANILIGRYYKADQVGYYAKAQNFGNLPSYVLYSIFGSVLFPTYCSLQNNQAKLINVYKRLLFNVFLIVTPIILILSLLSKPLIIILLTEKWSPSIPLFQLLLLSRMFLPLGTTHSSLIRSVGKTALYMKMNFILGPFSIIAIVAALPFGIKAIALAALISGVFSYIITALVAGNMFGYHLKAQLYDLRYVLLSLVIMSLGVYIVTQLIENDYCQLCIGILMGSLIYLICCRLFNLVDKETLDLIKSRIVVNRKKDIKDI